MAIIKEVLDALKDVADGIEHIRTVASAIRDGRKYLTLKYPEVKTDLGALGTELQNTATAVAAASAVLTHFEFTVAGMDVDRQPARFNDYLIAHKEKAALVARSLQAMRGHCHVIHKHAENLKKRAESLNLSRLLLLFGLDSAERDRQVAEALKEIYDEEIQGYKLVAQLSFALQTALNSISEALGPPGTMDPKNVAAAAKLLGEYAVVFQRLETQSNYLALDIQQSIDVLTDGAV